MHSAFTPLRTTDHVFLLKNAWYLEGQEKHERHAAVSPSKSLAALLENAWYLEGRENVGQSFNIEIFEPKLLDVSL